MNSYWLSSVNPLTNFNKIDNNYECDVCIIGAGIVGLTCRILSFKKWLKCNYCR